MTISLHAERILGSALCDQNLAKELIDAINTASAGGGAAGGSNDTYGSENKDAVSFYVGNAVCVHGSGTGTLLATAADPSRPGVGLATVGVAPGHAETVQCAGIFPLSDWSAVTGTALLAARATYWLSATAGLLTNVPPTSGILQKMGVAVSTTELELNIDSPTLL